MNSLYKELLVETEELKELTKNTLQYDSFLSYSDFNDSCNLLLATKVVKPRHEYFGNIPDLEGECKKCWKFYLDPRNKSIKKYDVIYGIHFEKSFISFLRKKGIPSDKADKKDKVLPDNLIYNEQGNVIAYYELKYHNAPFIMAYRFNKGRECYEGSITLDYEKIENQIARVRTMTNLPVFYLHWVDFPCIKGVFYMALEETEKALKEGVQYSRKEREGDYVGEKKVGYLKKFYPSLLEMQNLDDFIKHIKQNDK